MNAPVSVLLTIYCFSQNMTRFHSPFWNKFVLSFLLWRTTPNFTQICQMLEIYADSLKHIRIYGSGIRRAVT
jgi:hypothetical protein